MQLWKLQPIILLPLGYDIITTPPVRSYVFKTIEILIFKEAYLQFTLITLRRTSSE